MSSSSGDTPSEIGIQKIDTPPSSSAFFYKPFEDVMLALANYVSRLDVEKQEEIAPRLEAANRQLCMMIGLAKEFEAPEFENLRAMNSGGGVAMCFCVNSFCEEMISAAKLAGITGSEADGKGIAGTEDILKQMSNFAIPLNGLLRTIMDIGKPVSMDEPGWQSRVPSFGDGGFHRMAKQTTHYIAEFIYRFNRGLAASANLLDGTMGEARRLTRGD